MNKPSLIIIDGPMGSGKSTVAELLHEKIGKKTALISLDKLKRIVSHYELDSFEHVKLASKAGAAMANVYLKEGIDVIIEKAFTREEFLKSFIKDIKIKARLFVYQIEVPLRLAITRVKVRENKKEKGIPENKLIEKITRNHENYNNFKYDKAKIFNSAKMSATKITKQILGEIK